MRISIGIDVAKEIHWASAINDLGEVLLDRKLTNEPSDIEELLAELHALGGERVVGLDVVGGIASLVAAMLLAAGETVVHVPGLAVNRARQGTAGGESKSDPRDARVIADQVRTRRDLRRLAAEPEATVELRLLVARRRDLVTEQTRRLSRLHDLLGSIHPGLERALDLTTKSGLLVVARYVTPNEICHAGKKRIVAYLRAERVRETDAVDLADAALAAAHAQKIVLPGEALAADLCRELAAEALDVRERIARVDERLEEALSRHPDSALIRSLPGMGVVLACKFIVEAGDLKRFSGPDALAAAAGLAPVLRQSGRIRFLRRANHGNKGLKRVFYQSAFCSLRAATSRAFYDRKRREGKRHHQAILALARRRVNVLWAMLRDRRPFEARVPTAVLA